MLPFQARVCIRYGSAAQTLQTLSFSHSATAAAYLHCIVFWTGIDVSSASSLQ